jgi:hypothetical protein
MPSAAELGRQAFEMGKVMGAPIAEAVGKKVGAFIEKTGLADVIADAAEKAGGGS